jgi:poly-gamma-glutamate synthesis protein (capsule biosynthesis protein)
MGNRFVVLIAAFLFLSGCRDQAVSQSTARATVDQTGAGTAAIFIPNIPSPSLTSSPQVTQTASAQTTPSESKPTSTESAPVELAFVGDIMLGRSLAQKISQGKGDNIFESVRPLLQSADLAVGNLECAIGEGGKKAVKGYAFLAPPLSASELRNAGFDLLSLANNHSLDYGPDVFRQSLELLKDNEVQVVGAGENASQARAAVVYEIRGLRVAFLSYADVPVERGGFDTRSWTAGDSTPGIAWANDDEIVSNLQALKTKADFIVVLFHFGTEGSGTPNPRQVELSHLAVENGADLVVGSHPHLLQKEETYQGRLIFYSMGNFVFDGFSGAYNHSAILRVAVSRSRPVTYSLIPVILVNGIPILGQH